MGLCYHDALLIVPIYQTFWVLVSIIGGGVYFKEIQTFTATSGPLFLVGVLIGLAGIYILTYYRSKQGVSQAENGGRENCGEAGQQANGDTGEEVRCSEM